MVKSFLIKNLALIVFCITYGISNGFAKSPSPSKMPTSPRSDDEKPLLALRTSYQIIFNHLLRSDIKPGAVIASPSQNQPNYFYHWVRDAGLTMLELVSLYQLPLRPERKRLIETLIQSWINFEIQNQNVALSKSNLGEPIFTVHGDIYPNEWGRPQNDGPAIRALAMSAYAFSLIQQNRMTEARRLYRAETPATSPIKRDLEYIAAHWNEPNFDLWEEVKGDHFFTRMAQRTSLLLGSKLAHDLNDSFAASYYYSKAKEIESSLNHFIHPSLKYIVPTLNPIGGWKGKNSQLDSSIILAVLYFNLGDGFFDLNNSYVAQTSFQLESVFQKIYKINLQAAPLGILLSPGIGRYPEDVYNGSGFSEGNPWFITTNAFAEYYCRVATLTSRSPAIATQWRNKGLSFLNRSLLHSNVNGQMSEQFNRNNGYMQGAQDLTWSYVSYLRAYRSCYPEQFKNSSNQGF